MAEERTDGVLVLVLAGRISTVESARLQARIDAAVAGGDRRLVLDFAGVEYVASRGIGVLEAAHARLTASPGRLVLCELTDPVRIAIELAGSAERLAIEPTRGAAVAAASRPPDASAAGRESA